MKTKLVQRIKWVKTPLFGIIITIVVVTAWAVDQFGNGSGAPH
jgi:hypothetical protein